MIIDTHTHFNVDYDARDGADPTRWLEALEDERVDGAWVMGHRAMMPGADVSAANDHLANVVAKAPDRMVALCTVRPFEGQPARDEAERCVARLGMRGIKLHPWLQGFPSLFGPDMDALCELAGGLRAPLYFHDGTPNLSMPSQIGLLARRHRGTIFVLGHAGLMHLWRQAAETAALHANVVVCLSSPHPRALRHVIARVPLDRLIWGSDHGIGFMPRLGYFRRLMDVLALDEAQWAAIMGGNAARLLGWRPK